jgi:hypothetical protein
MTADPQLTHLAQAYLHQDYDLDAANRGQSSIAW